MKKILIIDDDKNLAIGLSAILLKRGYSIRVENEGDAGIATALNDIPDIILLDIGLPKKDGYQIKTIFNNHPQLRDTPVIFISARAEVSAIQHGLAMGSYDYITKPFHTEILISKIEGILNRQEERSNLHRLELSKMQDSTIEETLIGWANALETRMNGESGHSNRVAENTEKLAKLIGYPQEKMGDLLRGAKLHDIGKIGIPDSILSKEGKLSVDEWVIMKKHPLLAKEILDDVKSLSVAMDIPIYHHENFDGSGYPYGLIANEIPLAARIFAIIDVFDALSSDRPYRPAFTHYQCIEIMKSESNHFDPDVFATFLKHNEEFETGNTIFSE